MDAAKTVAVQLSEDDLMRLGWGLSALHKPENSACFTHRLVLLRRKLDAARCDLTDVYKGMADASDA